MATYNGNSLTGTEKYKRNDVINFDFSRAGKEIKFPKGFELLVESWGAEGFRRPVNALILPGKGGYSKGTILLKQPQTLFIYVGACEWYTTWNLPEFNGGGGGWSGGVSGSAGNSSSEGHASTGGGASDIRLVGGAWDLIQGLRSRIIIAGGGGGSQFGVSTGNGVGGGLSGQSCTNANGGTQTTGFSFGIGQAGASGYSWSGAGGGYYGGFRGQVYSTSNGYTAAGGSGFISGHPGCDAIRDEISTVHTGQPNHYSGLIFTETVMKSGNESMPNPRGTGNIIGNSGHGFVRITILNNIKTLILSDNEYKMYSDGSRKYLIGK